VTHSAFDVRPARPALVTAVLFVFVVFAASGFAYVFRWALHRIVERYADHADPTRAASSLDSITLFLIAAGSVAIAATIGHAVQRQWANRTGIEAVAASARGEGRNISFRATWLRVAATWIVSAGLVSIGRESAIVESGGSLGSVVGRRSGGRGVALAAAGIAAAFAAAYHAPVAAMLYAEEHLRVRQSSRAIVFVVLGAVGGFAFTVWLFGGGDPILPGVDGSLWSVLAGGLIVVVPVVVVSRVFLQLRVRVTADALTQAIGCRRWIVVASLSALAGVSVMAFPLASGNGMEALQRGPEAATVTLALSMMVGKLIGTTAALGAGAPGGVLSPTLAVAAGCALLVDDRWEAMVAAMAVGVAVGMRSPLVAVFLVPELLGAYRLVLPIAIVVGVAFVLDRGIDMLVARYGRFIPSGVYDEDA
jgi:CIC family chloride channel protein